MKKAVSVFAFLTTLTFFGVAQAEFVLQLPLGAKATYSADEDTLPAFVPISTFDSNGVQTESAPNNIRRTVWSFGGEQTLAEVENNILDQLQGSGYDILLFCQSESCGGFDFRFAIDVVDEPDMRVDLRDFRFVSARQSVTEQPAYVTFLLSKSPSSVYVQMTEFSPTALSVQIDQSTAPEENSNSSPQTNKTTNFEPYVLEGLEFETGNAQIGADPNGSIAALAERLKQNDTLRVILVGHSDMSGSLDGNIALSEKRAGSVLDVLASDFGIKRSRLSARGVGFLSPRASNETDNGRQKNRRIEAVFSN